jgi:hypothetical protein
MTEQNPYSAPAAQPSYQTAPKKPPLSPELKRTASVAGAVSFTIMSIGWGLFSTAVGVALFAGFFTWVVGIIDASGEGRDADYFRLMDVIDAINPQAWIIPLVIAGIVGAGLWALSLFISHRMLARAKHPSPWGVTWAGAGVAVAASLFVSWVAWLPLQFVGLIAPDAYDSFESGLVATIALGSVSLLLSLVVTVVLGWLSWWWMAHALRPAAPAAPVSAG